MAWSLSSLITSVLLHASIVTVSLRQPALHPFILLFYLWMHWAFVAVRRLSLVAVSRGCSPVAVSRLLIVVLSLVERGL